MRRTLLKLPLLLSLMFSGGSLGMWARSQYVDEAWVFEPRPVAGPPAQLVHSSTVGWWAGWQLERILGSTQGRLILVEHDEPRWTAQSPVKIGYLPPPVPILMLTKSSYVLRMDNGAVNGWVPGVAEWGIAPRQPLRDLGRRRFLSVSWLVPAAAGAVLPAIGAWRHWRRVQARRMNRCVVCGYDLRASRDRCPECGTAVAA